MDDTSKHTRWLVQILQSKTQYEKGTMNLYKDIENDAFESHKPWSTNVCIYNRVSLDLQYAKRVITGKTLQYSYKSGANQRFEFNSKIVFKWGSWVNKSLLTS